MRPLFVALLGVVALLSACASKPRFEPTALKKIAEPEVNLETAWSTKTGPVGMFNALRPLVAAGRVFVGDQKGEVHALDAQGEALWTVQTGLTLAAGPALVDGQLIFGSRDGDLLSLAALDGEERWRLRLSSEVSTVPAGDSELLAVKSEDGRIHALNPVDGSTLWVVPLTVPSLTWRGNAPLVVTSDAVLVGTSTGRLKALARADGAPLWEQVIAEPRGRSEVQRLVDVDAELLLAGPVIVAISSGGNLRVLRRENGQTIWERAVGGFVGAALDENCLYVVDGSDAISCLDPRSGAASWSQEQLAYRRLSRPMAWKGNVLVGDYDGYVHVLSAADGSIVGRGRMARAGIRWLGEAPEGGLLSLSSRGQLRAFDSAPANR